MNKVLVGLAAVGAVLGLMAVSYLSLQWGGFLGQAAEQIRYDIHKESQAYRDGVQRNIGNMIQQWTSANPAERTAIEATMRHQVSQVNINELPQYQQDFLRNTIGVY